MRDADTRVTSQARGCEPGREDRAGAWWARSAAGASVTVAVLLVLGSCMATQGTASAQGSRPRPGAPLLETTARPGDPRGEPGSAAQELTILPPVQRCIANGRDDLASIASWMVGYARSRHARERPMLSQTRARA